MYSNYLDFTESIEYDEYDLLDEKTFENILHLIKKNIVSPKVGFELYMNQSNINFNILDIFFNTYLLDINDLYYLPTDSCEPTTLLNSACEYRNFELIEYLLKKGADPNIKDIINYTPFQSLISGHSSIDIGEHANEIKNIIDFLLKYDAKLVLEQWQHDELYYSYIRQDNYFNDLLDNINIIDNIND
jgi:hypothetical protein